MLTPTRMLPWLLAVCLAGCSTARKTDVLEARLRSQEDMIAVYESEMKRVKTELASSRSETEDLRLQMADNGQAIVPAEESAATFRASGIQLSSLMTGGLDIDGEPGHDALSVVLIPHDPDGELVKLPGHIEIEALDPAHPEGSQRIGHWKFDQRDIHQFWHKGVVQSGYQFELPWQTPPRTDQVLVVAHLSTANGRQFDTTLSVKVDPPGGAGQPPMVPGVQQARNDKDNPFAVQQAAGETPADQPAGEEIIWAEGEGPGGPQTDWAREVQRPPLPNQQPLSRPAATPEAERAPRPGPPGRTVPQSPATRSAQRDLPPRIEDWWSDDDWATIDANTQTGGVQTSDSFTGETLPQYR